MSYGMSPAAPLRLTTAAQNRVLVGGVCETQPPSRARRALLCHNLCFAVAAIGCSQHSLLRARVRSQSEILRPIRWTMAF